MFPLSQSPIKPTWNKLIPPDSKISQNDFSTLEDETRGMKPPHYVLISWNMCKELINTYTNFSSFSHEVNED